MPDPTVDCLVITYAETERLDLCLEALRRQVFPSTNLIVSDDGSPNVADMAEVARRHGAVFLTRPRATLPDSSIPVRHIAPVLNRGVALTTADIVCILQQDFLAYPDYTLWLSRTLGRGEIHFPLRNHAVRPITMALLDSWLSTLFLPDGEVRYNNFLRNGRACLVEFTDWRTADGMDMAFWGTDWLDLDPVFIGQDHAIVEWALRSLIAGRRFYVNPLLRVQNNYHELRTPDEEVTKQLDVSDTYMRQKWDQDVWTWSQLGIVPDARQQLQERQEAYGVQP